MSTSIVTTIIFSKDRPLQLQELLEGLETHGKDLLADCVVLYRVSSPEMADAYQTLERNALGRKLCWCMDTDQGTGCDVLRILQGNRHCRYVAFFVDDCVCVRELQVSRAVQALEINSDTLGFSFRLGLDIAKAPMSQIRSLTGSGMIQLVNWANSPAGTDWSYPLELSSSIYRNAEIQQLLTSAGEHLSEIDCPNRLEAFLHNRRSIHSSRTPWLAFAQLSSCYCLPLNLVQTAWRNACSQDPNHSVANLFQAFLQGKRLHDLVQIPVIHSSCHCIPALPAALRASAEPRSAQNDPNPRTSESCPPCPVKNQ